MRLVTYLKINGVTRKELAQLVGCSPTAIGQIVSGEAQPRRDLAERIQHVTRGQVTVEELCYPAGSGPIGLDKIRAQEQS